MFVGLPDSFESEGFDRQHMRLPDCQNHLIQEILAVQPNTVVVLHNGSPVEMPWAQDVKGIIEAYLSGQVVGQAVVDILFGKVNPSAKLPETFPIKLEDNPSYLYYQGEGDCVEYKEGIFVGYRYYDTKKMNVLFPFGHGLSYTTFFYDNLRFNTDIMENSVNVMIDVTNTGDREGKEVVQLYVSAKNSKVIRPIQELRAFDKVQLAPGETKTVTFTLDKRAFSYWEVKVHDWYAENGAYEIRVGSSSRDIRAMKEIKVVSSKPLPFEYTLDTCFLDVLENPAAAEIVAPLKDILNSIFGLGDSEEADTSSKAASKDMMMAMIRYMPLRGIISFAGGRIKMDDILKIVGKLNKLNEVW